ncbi:unnamed protein product [Microthlaspi erraticum]|uniref:Uncharacterized protein n=1 Tax=Microthlaspi erraticum TaxID=1685480 RepID=A0A6D2KK18_9BRAS|nr:unnamed protein product [Microthlaspi erraticum]
MKIQSLVIKTLFSDHSQDRVKGLAVKLIDHSMKQLNGFLRQMCSLISPKYKTLKEICCNDASLQLMLQLANEDTRTSQYQKSNNMKSKPNALLIASTLVLYWILYNVRNLVVRIEQLNQRIKRSSNSRVYTMITSKKRLHVSIQ